MTNEQGPMTVARDVESIAAAVGVTLEPEEKQKPPTVHEAGVVLLEAMLQEIAEAVGPIVKDVTRDEAIKVRHEVVASIDRKVLVDRLFMIGYDLDEKIVLAVEKCVEDNHLYVVEGAIEKELGNIDFEDAVMASDFGPRYRSLESDFEDLEGLNSEVEQRVSKLERDHDEEKETGDSDDAFSRLDALELRLKELTAELRQVGEDLSIVG